jgi:6-phosphogluconate dehydrogenase
MAITEALPIIMPSIVKLLRSLFATKVVAAILTLSMMSMSATDYLTDLADSESSDVWVNGCK